MYDLYLCYNPYSTRYNWLVIKIYNWSLISGFMADLKHNSHKLENELEGTVHNWDVVFQKILKDNYFKKTTYWYIPLVLGCKNSQYFFNSFRDELKYDYLLNAFSC